jgi:hypothetical protein
MTPSWQEECERYADADLITGHIFKPGPKKVRQIKKEMVQELITEDEVMTNNSGKKLIQWAFIGGEILHRVQQELKGKIHIEVHAPLIQQQQPEEGEKWVRSQNIQISNRA